MKIGSLVICVDDQGLINTIKPERNKIYTIRHIRTVEYKKSNYGISNSQDGILLEEIVNDNAPGYPEEKGYKIYRFKEVMPPIANIEECINQNTHELAPHI